jgi:arylsulfatase A-like enzyme
MNHGVLRGASLLIAAVAVASASASRAQTRPPNFVLIFLDDSGWSDTSAYGQTRYRTPNIDRLAREGNRFTNFYVPQAVCSASRAALLTGSYPTRVSINGALLPGSRIGISAAERLLPEILKTKGYASGIFGKWHLGAAPQFLPTRRGFDEYFGIPYSNDMTPALLMEGERPLREMTQADRDNETTMLTERAVSFIERHRDTPFFLYVPHSMPHVPLAVSGKFKGQTGSLYADVMLEIDWSVGQILGALQRNGLDERTLVMFTSDNGPWLIYGNHAGSALPLREGKQTTFDGGHREPFIVRWPGHVKPNQVTDTMVVSFDLLPTLARLAGADAAVPRDRIIDGRDIWPWMSGARPGGEPHEVLYFYDAAGRGLEAVRSGRWKLHVPHTAAHAVPGADGVRGRTEPFQMELSLFDLQSDIGESRDVAAEHPDVVARLLALVERARDDLGDPLTGRRGRNVRPADTLPAGASSLPDGVPPLVASPGKASSTVLD